METQPGQQSSTHYDIVIVGAGPVGLMLSTILARWGYKIKHIDNRAEPTPTGRADGIQPRSLDLLRNMGLKSAIMAHKPARVYEVAFWDPPKSGNGIVRTGTWASCPDFIDARYPFTTLLHQGHIERVFISDLEKNGVQIQRPWTITGFTSDEAKNPEYPVEVRLEHVDGTAQETLRAKYLFGGEGARSFIRNQLQIGIKHKDPISHVWGVMDGVVKTDFPDIKVSNVAEGHAPTNPRLTALQMKCTIHSQHGSIMVIPREDNMVRLYIQIASSTDPDFDPRKTATMQEVQESAKRILQPYSIEWERTEWYSVYPIGQGISDRYTLDQRVFLGGDACHTHSPKAGQGMNTAFLDAQNLAWKIHAVESGFAQRDILKTYEEERRDVAETLLDFDNRYAKLFSQRPDAASEAQAAATDKSDPKEQSENEFIQTFKESCEFTSGYGVAYKPNALNWSKTHRAKSPLIHPEGTRLRTGRLFMNADVTRVVDANVVHLEQEIPLNGSFRIFVFAGKPSTTRNALRDFARHLGDKRSFLAAYLRNDASSVSHHEKHNPHSFFFTFCTVIAAKRSSIEISRDVPELLARYREHVYADDRWDRRVPDAEAAAHAKLGLDEEKGGVVVVRPDGYVGMVAKLEEGSGTVDALNEYFGAFCTKKLGGALSQL
ncbi:putative FAD binding domain-containing protein [Colletotrichum sublineola]|uniref:Putative FAD binding domain-containing protein n=1 Tax=Colletotrichum sublineola TaxID=1173701 RepID=A0A066X9G9_COLSU|nr:putative FAD binding domain-containing protein [Colletotrichum sublineola]